jgi:hypothetical protein
VPLILNKLVGPNPSSGNDLAVTFFPEINSSSITPEAYM